MLKLDTTWRKSSRSGDMGACVEVRHIADLVEVRDSKNRAGAVLSVSGDSWRAFVRAVSRGDFDWH